MSVEPDHMRVLRESMHWETTGAVILTVSHLTSFNILALVLLVPLASLLPVFGPTSSAITHAPSGLLVNQAWVWVFLFAYHFFLCRFFSVLVLLCGAVSKTIRNRVVRLSSLQFTLRASLTAVMILAAWLAIQVNRVNRQRSAIDAIEDYGYVVYEHELVDNGYDIIFDWSRRPAGPESLRRLLGDDYFRRVVGLNLAAHSEVFERLDDFPHLESLCLDASHLRDEQLADLARLPQIRSLGIGGATHLTEKGLEHLLAVDSLRELSISYTPITDNGVATLSRIRSLERLTLWHTGVTDNAVPTLSRMRSLKQLALWHTGITAEGERTLRELMPDTHFTPRPLEVTPSNGYVALPVWTRKSGRFTANHEMDKKRAGN